MAQGAAQAIEDAVVLGRCLAQLDDVDGALDTYAKVRRPRTHRVQRESHANRWLKDRFDPGWLYGHDVVDDLPPSRPASDGGGRPHLDAARRARHG